MSYQYIYQVGREGGFKYFYSDNQHVHHDHLKKKKINKNQLQSSYDDDVFLCVQVLTTIISQSFPKK